MIYFIASIICSILLMWGIVYTAERVKKGSQYTTMIEVTALFLAMGVLMIFVVSLLVLIGLYPYPPKWETATFVEFMVQTLVIGVGFLALDSFKSWRKKKEIGE